MTAVPRIAEDVDLKTKLFGAYQELGCLDYNVVVHDGQRKAMEARRDELFKIITVCREEIRKQQAQPSNGDGEHAESSSA